MISRILVPTLLAAALTACGGSSGGSGTNTGGGDAGGGNGGGDAVGGQSGTFGDTADAANGTDASSTICPVSVTGSFTGWAENAGAWCVWKCPADATIENTDGDEWGFIRATGETCRATAAAAGTSVSAPLYAAINGCPDGGCTDGSQEDFPRVLVTLSAGEAELAGDYQCATRTFNGGTDLWSDPTDAFSLSLPADGGASWSFSEGVLTIEGGSTFNNVAVGAGSFTSWNSNTSLVRCTTG